MLFTNDFVFRDMQRKSARTVGGVTLSPEEARRESMEADRELREHQRWREFAWLLFVAPIWASILIAVAQWLAAKWLGATP